MMLHLYQCVEGGGGEAARAARPIYEHINLWFKPKNRNLVERIDIHHLCHVSEMYCTVLQNKIHYG